MERESHVERRDAVAAAMEDGRTVTIDFVFFFYGYGDHRDLHAFPTRRSSDLQELCLIIYLIKILCQLLDIIYQ